MTEHVDVLIVGGGMSGIGAAARITRERPRATFAVLESRSAIGGTWDLFRYPGVRSDSDMYTLGYSFRPWTDGKAIADGAAIRDYIRDTARDEGLEPHIRLNHRAVSAEWSSATARWTVTVARTPVDGGEHRADTPTADTTTITCSFLSVCSGYYRYDEGFSPAIPGADDFAGRIVHPQHWPADLDWTDQRVVVVGSGATAVTLVPSLAKDAAHVTMLQRSPTYIAPVPARDHLADRLRGRLPEQLAYDVVRAKNIVSSMITYQTARRRPQTMKAILRRAAVSKLPADFDVDTHLSPNYEPWDQRLCAIPNGDLFRSISAGDADIVTDRIARITATGIDLASGDHLPADVIVTATGLNLLMMGGMRLVVDGTDVNVSERLTYKGMMLEGVPNFALTIGYTNASWTLKADLVAGYVCRVLEHMDRHGYQTVVPEPPRSVRHGDTAPLIDLRAGYVLRNLGDLPRQGARTPWRLHQNYLRDFRLLRVGRLTDDVRFGHRTAPDPLALPGTGFVTVDGTRIRYRRTGSGSPVLLLHGIGQSLEDWTEQHERLGERHEVLSLDLPGFAFSARRPGRASLARLAAILPAVLDALGVTGPVPVIGNSLGGAVAMRFAVDHPDRVGALVLVDSAGFGSEVTLALRLLAIRPIAGRLLRPSLRTSGRTVRALFSDRRMVSDDRVARAFALARRRPHAATLAELAEELGTFRGVRAAWRDELLPAVQALDLPTLVLWGDDDQILPVSHLAAATDAFPAAASHVFPGTGHMPQIERPDEFAERTLAFLDATQGRIRRNPGQSGQRLVH
ncbi:alpha/beta fold hydrolase [Curtobacterium sp. Leaf261]|uniref:alpha/beta fold hydrolase n=1 Tax=Curtobacterium sp. Leaf261 TaxID=1736311 RepID=UPI00138F836D|nr:alpha/beta fold hydrolase [Curtobacterium sp. Leaf261]